MGVTYNTSVVRDGLVLHLDAANVKSYPGSGTNFYNIAKPNQNLRGVLAGGALEISGGIVFDGTDDGIRVFNSDLNSYTVGDDVNISPTTNFTIEQTFKPTFLQTDSYYSLRNQLLRKGQGASTLNFWTQIDTDTTFKFYVRSNAENLKSVMFNTPSMTNNVNTVTIIVNNLSIECYHNGQYMGQQTMNSNPVAAYTNDTMGIGDFGVSQTYFTGTYYDCKLYNRTLTDAEIHQNFEALRGRYGI